MNIGTWNVRSLFW